jgi:hypothetical protein
MHGGAAISADADNLRVALQRLRARFNCQSSDGEPIGGDD